MAAKLSKRGRIAGLVALLVVLGVALAIGVLRYPADTTPEGAYLRIARAVGQGTPAVTFAYLEEDAQHALFTIRGYGHKASQRIQEAYPLEAQAEALAPYRLVTAAADVEQLWAAMAQERGWLARLRRDMSGIDRVEIVGERATVITARGTRYPFRKRPNGMWGTTLFSAELIVDAERMARDWERIQGAADDYERARREQK